jgi:hypothetical protein
LAWVGPKFGVEFWVELRALDFPIERARPPGTPLKILEPSKRIFKFKFRFT